MICGGNVVVHFNYISGEDEKTIEKFETICDLFDGEQDAWLITNLAPDGGSLSVYVDGTGLLLDESLPLDRIKPYFKSRGMLLKEEPSYYIEPLTEKGQVYVFGGGHVSQELVPVLSHLGFKVSVFEDRTEFATEALFPTAVQCLVGDFSKIDQQVSLKPSDYVIIMTRGHQADYLILEQVLRQPLFYVGVIGSRHKKAQTFSKLMDAGIESEILEQVHTPIGLEINAETPAEIAISIAGELIQCRAQKKLTT
jgi:xanthine dehydrogenase accessory factor